MTPLEKICCFLAESNRIEGLESEPEQYFDYISGLNPIVVKNTCAAWRVMTNAHQPFPHWMTLTYKKLSRPKINKLHMWLMRDLLPTGDVGVYRTCGVRVGSYFAPDHSQIRPLMSAFMKRFAEGKTDPLTMHYEFEAIHPFIDGNGRVGRLIWAWDLLRRGKQVHPILDNFDGDDFEEKRHEYYSALRAYHG